MIQRYRFIFAFLFIFYVIAQLVSFGLQGKKNLGWFERSIVFITTPAQRLVSWSVSGVSDIWNHYFYLVNVSRERDKLKDSVDELKTRLVSAREIEQENHRLQKLLDMPQNFHVKVAGAQRIASGTSSFQRVIRVQHSGGQTLVPGMSVVSPQGIVGQVLSAFSDSADILLIVDKTSAMDVIDQRSRATGTLRGQDIDRLSFEFVRRGTDLQVGDEIVSSGLDGVYQKGIPVGIVTEVGKDSNKLYVEAYVKPHVNFSLIEEVGIVTKLLPVPIPTAVPSSLPTVKPLLPAVAAPSVSIVIPIPPVVKPKPTVKPKPKPIPTPIRTPTPSEDAPELPMAEEELIP